MMLLAGALVRSVSASERVCRARVRASGPEAVSQPVGRWHQPAARVTLEFAGHAAVH